MKYLKLFEYWNSSNSSLDEFDYTYGEDDETQKEELSDFEILYNYLEQYLKDNINYLISDKSYSRNLDILTNINNKDTIGIPFNTNGNDNHIVLIQDNNPHNRISYKLEHNEFIKIKKLINKYLIKKDNMKNNQKIKSMFDPNLRKAKKYNL